MTSYFNNIGEEVVVMTFMSSAKTWGGGGGGGAQIRNLCTFGKEPI